MDGWREGCRVHLVVDQQPPPGHEAALQGADSSIIAAGGEDGPAERTQQHTPAVPATGNPAAARTPANLTSSATEGLTLGTADQAAAAAGMDGMSGCQQCAGKAVFDACKQCLGRAATPAAMQETQRAARHTARSLPRPWYLLPIPVHGCSASGSPGGLGQQLSWRRVFLGSAQDLDTCVGRLQGIWTLSQGMSSGIDKHAVQAYMTVNGLI